MSIGKSTTAAVAALGVFALVAPALGQDNARATTDREEAVKTLPTWAPYGSQDPQTVEESFFRLSQDFVTTSELGVRRLGAVPIWPRGDLKIGRVRILPYVRQAVEWQTNLYRQSGTNPTSAQNPREGRESAWSWITDVGALADTQLMGGRMRVTGSVTGQWNTRVDDEDPDDFEMDSQVGVAYRFNQDLWASAGVAYERRSEPISAEFEDRFKRSNTHGFATVGLDGDPFFNSKTRFELGLDVRDVQGREDGLDDLDRTEVSYRARASYPIWRETTRAFVEARYRDENRESRRVNDGNVIGLNFGLEGSIPIVQGEQRGLRGSVSMGYEYAQYEDGTFFEGQVNQIRDDNRRNANLNVEVALQYIASPRSSVDLRYLRQNQFSFHGNYQIVDRAELTYSRNFTRKLVGRIAGFYEHTNPSGLIAPLRVDGQFTPTSHANNVNRGGVGVGVRYPIEDWIDLDATVDWERRNSSDTNAYSNYRGILGVTFHLGGLKDPRNRSNRGP